MQKLKKKRTLPANARKQSGKGRPKGSKNRYTRVVKEAILLAAEAVGQDGRGKDGLVGYLTNCARRYPKAFMTLIGKVLPVQITGADDGPLVISRERVAAMSDEEVTVMHSYLKKMEAEAAGRPGDDRLN